MTVPIIPRAEQVPIMETTVLQVIRQCYGDDIALQAELTNRLRAGAAKYGMSWNEVNLTEDLREEILDVANYIAMLVVRREHVNEGRGGADDVLLGMLAELVLTAYKIISGLEPCVGPTSKEWALMHGEPGQQLRFQETLAWFRGEGQA